MSSELVAHDKKPSHPTVSHIEYQISSNYIPSDLVACDEKPPIDPYHDLKNTFDACVPHQI